MYKQLALIFILITFVVAATALAGTGNQNSDLIPTPTLHPVSDVEYDLKVVGGTEIVHEFQSVTDSSIVIENATAVSNYPNGIRVEATIRTVNEGEILDVIVIADRENGQPVRHQATNIEETNLWFVDVYNPTSAPPWTNNYLRIRATDSNGNFVETPIVEMEYDDPTRSWYRVESEHVIVFWFGFGEFAPEVVAERIAQSAAAVTPRLQAGFPVHLSALPRIVIFPTDSSIRESIGQNPFDPNNVMGITTEYGAGIVYGAVRQPEFMERNANCMFVLPVEEQTEAYRLGVVIDHRIPTLMARFYERENGGLGLEPSWWNLGQSRWFGGGEINHDERLRLLAEIDPSGLPSLAEASSLSRVLVQADGCSDLSISVGVSFMNWLLHNYGGIETHRAIVDTYVGNNSIDVIDAIEAVVGIPFLELENTWRAYIGFDPVAPAVELEDASEAAFVVGDTVVIPGPRPVIMQNEVGSGIGVQCFPGTTVTILQVGQLDGVIWYEIECSATGWVTEDDLN